MAAVVLHRIIIFCCAFIVSVSFASQLAGVSLLVTLDQVVLESYFE